MQYLTAAEWLSQWEGLAGTGFDMCTIIKQDDAKARDIAARYAIPFDVVSTEYGDLARLPVIVWETIDLK
jgi:hypothetical protein